MVMFPAEPSEPLLICIGRLVKSHQTSGQFLCHLFNPLQPDDSGQHRLSQLRKLEVRHPRDHRKQALELEGMLLMRQDELGRSNKLLLKCGAWNAPEQIRPFHGWELWVEEHYASPCAEGEFHYRELIGAELYHVSEAPKGSPAEFSLGQICGLMEGGAQLLLEVRLAPHYIRHYSQEYLYLPFHDSVIGQIQRGIPLRLEVRHLEYFNALLNKNDE